MISEKKCQTKLKPIKNCQKKIGLSLKSRDVLCRKFTGNSVLRKASSELQEQVKRSEDKIDNLKHQMNQEVMQEVFEESEETKSYGIIFNIGEKYLESIQERIDGEFIFCEELFQGLGLEAHNGNIVELEDWQI